MTRVLIFLLLCFVAICAGIYISFPHREFAIGTFTFVLPAPQDEGSQTVHTSIRFVGDIMLARNVENLMDAYGSAYPYDGLPAHPQGQYLVGNFEGSIPAVHVPTQSMQFSFSVDPAHLDGLRQYGFTHLSLANNHAYDFGGDDFAHGRQLLEEHGFTVFGDPGELGTSSITYLDVGTTTVALVGVYAVHQPPATDAVASVFAEASRNSDLQIAYIHWGEEYKLIHNAFQERVAQGLIDAGADAVIGHHPHVVQDIGLYKDVPIFYSIGNFIFDQYFSEDVQNGLALDATFGVSSIRFDIVPVTSIGTRSQPRIMGAYEREVLLKALAEHSDPAGAQTIENGYIEVSF